MVSIIKNKAMVAFAAIIAFMLPINSYADFRTDIEEQLNRCRTTKLTLVCKLVNANTNPYTWQCTLGTKKYTVQANHYNEIKKVLEKALDSSSGKCKTINGTFTTGTALKRCTINKTSENLEEGSPANANVTVISPDESYAYYLKLIPVDFCYAEEDITDTSDLSNFAEGDEISAEVTINECDCEDDQSGYLGGPGYLGDFRSLDLQ